MNTRVFRMYIYIAEDPYHMLGRTVHCGGRETMNEREDGRRQLVLD